MRSASRITRLRPISATRRYTFDEFCVLVKDGQKADLMDGVIYMASPDNLDAGELYLWLVRLIGDYLEFKNLGQIFGSRTAFRLDEHHSPEPDLAFVKAARLNLARKGFFNGPPDVAFEIVSPDSVQRDYEDKRSLYEKFRVPEYWIIDEDAKQVTLLHLDRHGKYRQIRPRKGVLHSRELPGFWVRIAWLWKETRPTKTAALNEILAAS